MQSFLSQIAAEILEKHGNQLSSHLIVLPSRRAISFLHKAFKQHAKGSVWLPQMLSIDDFVKQLTRFEHPSDVEMLLAMYPHYVNAAKSKARDFDDFIQWGGTLLRDFSEWDAYLCDTNALFTYAAELEAIERWNPEGGELSAMQIAYQDRWKWIAEVYKTFSVECLEKGKTWSGLSYRHLIENIDLLWRREFSEVQHAWFLGFNAINAAEEQLLNYLAQNNLLNIRWDSDAFYSQIKNHEAGFFYRKHASKFEKHSKVINENGYLSPNKHIRAHSAVGIEGMVNTVSRLLNELSPKDWAETAVVLADETILISLLEKLPAKIPNFNITLGYPLGNSPYLDWIRKYFTLQLRASKKQNKLYHRDFHALAGHAVMQSIPEWINTYQKIKTEITQFNRIEFDSAMIDPFLVGTQLENSLPKDAFAVVKSPRELLEKCNAWLAYFLSVLKPERNKMATEQLLTLRESITRLYEIVEANESRIGISGLKTLFERVLANERIAFVGEPLEGLQVMGMLETRNLDFKRIVVLSVNEGILPAGKSGQSFLPFEVRRHFELPTHYEKDAVFAYHFYRLLQRCDDIHLVSDAMEKPLKGQEESRFIKQLEIEWTRYNPQAIFERFNHPVTLSQHTSQTLVVHKTPEVIEKVKAYLSKRISPSALNTYINSPFDFYFKYVLGIREQEEADEQIDSAMYGEVIHKVLEDNYAEMENQLVSPIWLKQLAKTVDSETQRVLDEKFIPTERGENYLQKAIARQTLKQFYTFEEQRCANNEVIYLKSEEELNATMQIGDFTARFLGKADRVETLNGLRCIIDYKTGKCENKDVKFDSFEELFDSEKKKPKALQLAVYVWMYAQSYEGEIQSAILSMPTLFTEGLIKLTYNETTVFNKTWVLEFEQHLKNLIEEILNPEIPFAPRSNEAYVLFPMNVSDAEDGE